MPSPPPNFRPSTAARPAREMLAGLSYSQAVAWVGARLAEALDHAFSRDVAHGDVKPSNILLSADGNPLLLDFNLARDWSPAGLSHSIDRPRRNARLHGSRAIARPGGGRSRPRRLRARRTAS